MNNSPLFGLPEDVIKKIRAVFAKYNAIKTVTIYGSRAMGTYRQGSDIDLCIEAKTLDLTQLLKIDNELDDLLLPWKIDLSLKHSIDNPNLMAHIKEKGVLFFGA